MKKEFKRFWIDSNPISGYIESQEDFEEAKNILKEQDTDILNAKSVIEFRKDDPNFGFRREHRGSLTLGEWLKDNT